MRGCLVWSWATYCGSATTEVSFVFRLSKGIRQQTEQGIHSAFLHAVTAVATGVEALEALRSTGAGTFQLVLTVSHVGSFCFGKDNLCSASLHLTGCHDAGCGRHRITEACSAGREPEQRSCCQ